jgi:hypothetical protein
VVRPAQKPARPAVVSRATTGMRAIAIRQPWAWAVIYAGKDCENRSERASRAFQAAVGKRIYVHASKAFPTKAELAHAIKSLRRRGIECPDPNESAEKSQVAIFRCLPGRREGQGCSPPLDRWGPEYRQPDVRQDALGNEIRLQRGFRPPIPERGSRGLVAKIERSGHARMDMAQHGGKRIPIGSRLRKRDVCGSFRPELLL